ncbi:hypothetical protein HDV01_003272 [Terramyces sp. JEL0728]|nr:hypothetical protein HDV01_003272 [Terramyces sp. JEL0728]
MSLKKQLIQRLQDAGLGWKLLPEPNLSSAFINGSKTFIPPICKLEIFYNPPRDGAGGDSQGMVNYLNNSIKQFAKQRPYLEVAVTKRSGPPEVVAHYNNGAVDAMRTPRWKPHQIGKLINDMCDISSPQNKERQFPRNVKRGAGSHMAKALPEWSPFTAEKIFKP